MTFERVYRSGAWGNGDSRSGPGSGWAATRNTAASLVALVAALGVETVTDVGCGDGAWMPDLPGYRGVDESPTALELHHERHPDRWLGPATWPLPPADLVLCRDVIQHLALDEGVALLSELRNAAGRWMLLTTYIGGANVGVVRSGSFAYSPDLTAWPFSMPHPVALIFDGWGYEDPDAIRDPGRMLGLWPAR